MKKCMSKFSIFKIKWPKSVEKLENGGRLSPLRQNLPPPKKKNGPLDPPVHRVLTARVYGTPITYTRVSFATAL